MIEKRFTIHTLIEGYEVGEDDLKGHMIEILDNGNRMTYKECCDLLNALHEENQELKQSNEEARQILKKEFDFATEQRQKHLDDPVVANAYDIIRYDMRRALDKLGGYDD